MGFQQPPTLPDYSKLLTVLNNSGVQSWNPAVFDILSKLIQAVQQSQTVISANVAEVTTTGGGGGGGTSVSTKPFGALDGDGSAGFPLGVNVDNLTVTIDGSNNLTVALASNLFYTLVNIPPDPGYSTLQTIPITLIPGVPGLVIVPIASTFIITKPAGSIGNPSPIIQYKYSNGQRWTGDNTPGMGAGWTTWYALLDITKFIDFTNSYNGASLMINSNFNMGSPLPSPITSVKMGILYMFHAL